MSYRKKIKTLVRSILRKFGVIPESKPSTDGGKFPYEKVAFKIFKRELESADKNLDETLENTPIVFKDIPLEVFGHLLLNIPKEYETLNKLLPKMPPDEYQIKWTGCCGKELLEQSLDFIKSLTQSTKLSNHDEPYCILDYGCGWGRLSRLLYKYVSPSKIWSLDPWDKSLELCHESNLKTNLLKCDEIPTQLNVGDIKFQLIFAFSVFTHLSEKTSHSVLNVLRQYIADDGILAITIRPVEYWRLPFVNRHDLVEVHNQYGFAFAPHDREPIDGEVTYGDTSMSLDYIQKNYTQWSILNIDWNISDPYQLILFLKPSKAPYGF